MDTLGIPADDFYRTHARNRLFATITIIHSHVKDIYRNTEVWLLLNFVSSQFARQVTMERFIREKAVNEPAELLSKLLSFLYLHGDHRISIDFMEQNKYRKCEKYTTKMSAKTSITVAEITNSALSKWFTDYTIKFWFTDYTIKFM